MNKKGFTLIELITTFAMMSVIIIFLFNIILTIKNIYSKHNVKTELVLDQSNLSYQINKKFKPGNLTAYSACTDSDFCFSFTFLDGTSSKLIVRSNSISFNNYVYKISEGTNIGECDLKKIEANVSSADVNNSFLVIKIPITNKLYPDEDFGISVVYQYNSNKTLLE